MLQQVIVLMHLVYTSVLAHLQNLLYFLLVDIVISSLFFSSSTQLLGVYEGHTEVHHIMYLQTKISVSTYHPFLFY